MSESSSPAPSKAFFVQPGQWTYASKLTIRTLMRPNMPLKVRIFGCLMLQSFGYETDLAVIQKRLDGKPLIMAFSPLGLRTMLQKAAIEDCAASGIPLSDDQKKNAQSDRRETRRALEEMEEDGLLVRVVFNAKAQQLLGLSLSQAIDKRLVTPLRDLPLSKRKKLASERLGVYLLEEVREARRTAADAAYAANADAADAADAAAAAAAYAAAAARHSKQWRQTRAAKLQEFARMVREEISCPVCEEVQQ